ncbi:hypothetical protein PG989_014278 [Apiospora arundinis]
MAGPGGKFWIHEKLSTPAVHHQSFKALWETKWKPLCDMGVYPFMFGATKDFQPVVDEIIQKDLKEPYDWDEYAQCFFPKAEELVSAAITAEKEGNKPKASELYLRASALYRIARFPAPRSERQRYAWEMGKEAARKGLGLHEFPMIEVNIPHTKHAGPGDGSTLPGFYHLPAGASSSNKVPLVIIFTGLDGYRTELAVWKEGWRQAGCATLIVEIPGTGDNPGAPADPASPDRVWSSMFDWVARQPEIDQARIVNWGVQHRRLLQHPPRAHTRRQAAVRGRPGRRVPLHVRPSLARQCGSPRVPLRVSVPVPKHCFVSLMVLSHTLCYKFGYGKDFTRFKKEAMDKFSLLKDGTLDKPCAQLILVNGTEDEIFPIDDYHLCLQHGSPKRARFIRDRKHMGEPESFMIILQDLFDVLEIKANPGKFLSTLPFQPKY